MRQGCNCWNEHLSGALGRGGLGQQLGLPAPLSRCTTLPATRCPLAARCRREQPARDVVRFVHGRAALARINC